MTKLRLALAVVSLSPPAANGQTRSTAAEIDADVWTPIAAAVAKDDITGMGRAYHGGAVLVTPERTRPISEALTSWERDMLANKAKGIRATVALRFANRQDDVSTAFESGIFKYTLIDRGGTAKPSYRRFEALLVKREGKWRILMERQLDAVTESAWNALH